MHPQLRLNGENANPCGASWALAVGLIISSVWCAPAEPQWHQEKNYRWADLPVPSQGKTGFEILSPDRTGIHFTNLLDTHTGEANRVLFNGSGVAVGDIDNDGLVDLYFCSLDGRNALYKNLGGFKFQDVTSTSGIACSNQFCRGAVFADVNGDGSLDLLIATTGNGVLCFTNDGHGHFADFTHEAGTATHYGSVTMALADVDGNGTLDLYVANNRTDDIRDHGQVDVQMLNGKLIIPPALTNRLVLINGKLFEYGEPDVFYLNDGRGHFTAVPWTAGAFLDEDGKPLGTAPLDWGLTASFRDFNGDGFPDLYVCNDYWTPDRIWINDGHGHFRAAPKLAFRHTSASSMGVDFADVNRSGQLDILVVDMLSRDLRMRKRQMFAQTPMASPLGAIDNRPQIMRNTLFANRGDGTFGEIADYAGVSASEWCWSPTFLDVDLDGYEDVLIPAGHSRDVQDLDAEAQIRMRAPAQAQIKRIADPKARLEAFINNKIENAKLYPPLDMPIVAFHNLGQYRFEEATSAWGTDNLGVHHALALGDLDGDGAQDVIVNNLGTAAGVYRNRTAAPRVAVRLKGRSPNSQAIGATIKLLRGAVPMQSKEIISGGRYMSGSDTLTTFAAGTSGRDMSLEVKWRNGGLSRVEGVRANRLYEITETDAETKNQTPAKESQPLFEDRSNLISHSHHEEPFNDFERQPLLPRKLSQSGPALAWADLDGDGWDDLIIGTGKGGRVAIYLNEHGGGFTPVTGGLADSLAVQDQVGITTVPAAGGKQLVLVGSANYEDAPGTDSKVLGYNLNTNAVQEVLAIKDFSPGPLAVTDMDGDGELELFVGGRVVAGRYPEPASSRIYRLRDGKWQEDAQNSRVLDKLGLVSGAVWSDLDADGFPELILACEWGPIRIFHNDKGKLTAWNPAVELGALGSGTKKLNELTGWWNGVTTGDLDGSGRMAIIAGNLGMNTPYRASAEHPSKLFYGDFAGRGVPEIIEAEYDPALGDYGPRRMRNMLSSAIPDVVGRFNTQRGYSEATVAQVLGDRMATATEVDVICSQSMALLNETGTFQARPLPLEAQWAPAFSPVVADFDGDGSEDIFLSQNFFPNEPEVARYDAGRGLLLKGDGTGTFHSVPGRESGVSIYGEQRSAAAADFDQDGRVDLAITENAGATRLFHNSTAKPGIRVQLIGPEHNPSGIGAQVRLVFGNRKGPIREIHSGSGYWSQDSMWPILALPEKPKAIWVRWPGGRISEEPITGNPKSVSVRFQQSR